MSVHSDTSIHMYIYIYIYIYICLCIQIHQYINMYNTYLYQYAHVRLAKRTAYCNWSVIQSQSPISISFVSLKRNVAQDIFFLFLLFNGNLFNGTELHTKEQLIALGESFNLNLNLQSHSLNLQSQSHESLDVFHYGVALISRLLKIIGLFCKRAP